MAAHFVGFFIGSVNASTLIIRVGSIRAFAAFASLISAIGVAHLLSDNLPLWVLLRFIYGYCFAATGVIVESWLNNHALPTTRGRLLAVYGVVSTGALGLSQLAVGFSPPTNFNAVCCFIHYRFVVFGADGPIRHIARAAPVGISPPKNQRPVAKHADWRRRCFNLRDRVFVIIILGTCVCQLIGF